MDRRLNRSGGTGTAGSSVCQREKTTLKERPCWTTKRVERARRLYEEAAGGYVDVHAWQFTPESFRSIVTELGDVVPFQVERVYNTLRDRNEFGAILRLPV